ncbi:MAG: DUF6691 family protein [Cyanobacteriota bacterium]
MVSKVNIASFVSGLIFAIGLGISGMMNTSKVQGFLDITGKWDPSLLLVMGGGLFVTFFAFPLIFKRGKPILQEKFIVTSNKKIDKDLLIGAFLFGIGWGIGGLCPGPALANLATLNFNVIIFVISMISGFFIQQTSVSCLTKKKASLN